jgi:hypothetical protein
MKTAFLVARRGLQPIVIEQINLLLSTTINYKSQFN